MVGFGKQSIDPFHLTHIAAKYIEKSAKGHQEIGKKMQYFSRNFMNFVKLTFIKYHLLHYKRVYQLDKTNLKNRLKMIQKIDSIMCVKMSIPHFIKSFIFPEKNCSLTWQCPVIEKPFVQALYEFR